MAGEKDFDASVKKVARGRVAVAEGLRFKTCAASVEPGGEHARVVEDDEIVGTEQIGQFAELAMGDRSGRR